MMNNNFEQMFGMVGLGGMATFGVVMLVLIAWTLFWKGLGLWHASKNNKPYWFVAFLLINSVGILELIFLFGVLKIKFNNLFKNNQ